MKITTQLFFDRFIKGIQDNMAAILKGNEQIASSKKVNRPSDDPTAMSRIVNYKTSLSSISEYKRAIDTANSMLQAEESAYTSLNTSISRAAELALGGATGTMDAQSRSMTAKEIGVILETAMGIANTKVGDRYIFAGYQSSIAPINDKTGEFVSDANAIELNVSDAIKVGINIPANNLFSFKRINPTDPDGAVLPSYNWDITGSYSSTDSVYEDADPNSALYTSKPANFYLNGTNNTIRVNGVDYDVFIVNKSNNKIVIDGVVQTIATGNYTGTGLAAALAGIGGGGVIGATYNAGTKQFNITAGTAANINFGNPNTTIEQLIGFSSTDKTIGGGITSDITTSNGVVSGSDIAAALSGLGAGISASYDSAMQKFTITSAGGATVNFGHANMTMEQMLGFNSIDRTIGAGAGIASDFESVHVTDPSKLFSSNGGTLNITVGDANNNPTPVNVTIAAGSSLNQIRDAINASKAGVKAEVVNTGTTTTPDYRLVIASNPVGHSDTITITASTLDAAGTGLNTLVRSASVDTITVSDANRNIIFDEGAAINLQAQIDKGTYTADELAAKIKAAIESAPGRISTNTYDVVYDSTNKKFKITNNNPGSTDTLDLKWENANSSAASIMGFSASDHIAISPPTTVASDNVVGAGPFVISLGINDKIVIREGSRSATITMPAGTYTGAALATALKSALESATASDNAYDVAYDPRAGIQRFRITGSLGNTDNLDILWTDPNSTAAGILGFTANDTVGAITTAGDNTLTYGFQNNNLGTNITNYNYITDTTNANYYSFNNNYLNETYALRALNFLKVALEHNDTGRIEKAIDYLSKITDKVSQNTAEVGARLNKLDAQEKYHENRDFNITSYLSNDQDTDIGKVMTEMTQRQNALQGLRTISTEFMKSSLFDFLK